MDVLLGEPMLPDCESEGEARATLELPPPLVLGAPPPPCDAEGKAAAEEAKCEAAWEAMVLERPEDSSWPCECCCCDPDCDGEKGDDVDEADEVRLMMRRVPDDATDGGLLTGEKEGSFPVPSRCALVERQKVSPRENQAMLCGVKGRPDYLFGCLQPH